MMKSWRRRELEEKEAEEVVVMDLEKEGSGGSEEVSWENFLPRGSLRVLLVEGDDSTRQIIAALLRKCNYKVDAVSDGKKGWEILMERPESIDLVLAEVEVPSICGLGLLNMIMDRDVFKNIPVIMMSSHDSVNMVYKCMLKGAADFLVKPIRRNELGNLWQHVWRRHSLIHGHGGATVHQDGNLAKRRHEDMSEKENHLSEYAPALKKIKECSETGSYAESSCTRFNMEAESRCKQSMQDPKQTTYKAAFLCSEVKPFDLESVSNEQFVEEEHSCLLVETMNEDIKLTESIENSIVSDTQEKNCYHDTHPKEAIDLIGMMENKPESAYWLRNYMANSNDPKLILDKDVSPLLELSLRRYTGSDSEEERGECGTLSFPQYNSRVPAVTFPVEVEELFSTPTGFIPDQDSGNSSSIPRWYDPTPNTNMADMSPGARAPTQSGKEIKCPPLRVIPSPFPVRGMNFDLNSGYGPLMMPMFYPQSSAIPSWKNIPSMWQEGIYKDPLHEHIEKSDYQSPEIPILHSEQMQETSMEQRDEHMHVSSVGDSGSSSICNGNATDRPNTYNALAEVGNGEVKQLTEMYRLRQREAALNKFRMKRKDRCFEKKVRYQSRKKLAEQRPRVKGQFARHAQPEPPSVEV